MSTQRVIAVKPINHLKHGFWTVMTGGLWGIGWAAIVIYRKFDR